MKAAAFDYVRPRDLGEVVTALQGDHAMAKLVAGGQSLLPMLNLRLARPSLLIDVSRIEALRGIEDHGDRVRIGAAVTHAELEDRDIVGCPMLREVAGGIAYRSVRNRGTIGGSMAHADPAADWPLALAALGASVIVQGRGDNREISAQDFMLGAFRTQLAEQDIVVAIDVPKMSSSARYGYFKFCRKTGEFPEASAAAVFDPERKIARIYVGALSGAPKPLDTLARQIAENGQSGATVAAIAKAVEDISDADVVHRRMRRTAVARAIERAFAS